jgi:hypothetical protein
MDNHHHIKIHSRFQQVNSKITNSDIQPEMRSAISDILPSELC